MRRVIVIALVVTLIVTHVSSLLSAETMAAHREYPAPRDSLPITKQDSVPLFYTIPNITIETPRGKYSKEDNPAITLVLDAMEGERNRRDSIDYSYHLRGADRLTLSLANFDLKAKWLNTLFSFFPKYVTRSRLDGKWVLPLSIRDRISDYGYSVEDKKWREVIRYSRHTGLDQTLDDGTMTVAIEDLFPEVDLYGRDVRLLQTHFASPLSSDGLSQYKYYLTDTLIMRGQVAQTVTFFPFVPSDPTFRGHLYFTVTDPPRLLRSELIVPQSTNLNFVDALSITQEYDPVQPDKRQVSEEALSLSFRLYWRLLSLYVEQTRHYGGREVVTPGMPIARSDTLLFTAPQAITDLSSDTTAVRYRPETERMLASDQGLKDFLAEVKAIPIYRFLLDAADMISLGYIRTRYDRDKLFGGSYFDIGPITKMIGFNEVEGNRLRLGGRTTGFISPRFFLEGYLAYGFRDHELKHSLSVIWSFLPKGYFREEFPRDELQFSYSHDLFTPGQLYATDPQDNTYYHFGTTYLTNRSYRNIWQIQYIHDYGSTLSLRVYLQHVTDTPAEHGFPYLKVQRDGDLLRQWSITDAAAGVEVRWAPGERIRPGSMERHSPFKDLIKREYPVLFLKHETAARVLGGEYLRHRTEIRLEQRLPMGIWGRMDYQVTVGKLWNTVPFPLLYIPPTNRGFTLHDNAFKILYPLEYVADEWATLFAQWHMRGLILNRIPLLNKLSLRGVWSVNYLYGNTSKLNQQAHATDIFILPTIATEMRHQSYVELGFGLENILKLGRIDVYRRLTAPGAYSQGSPWAVRGTLRVDF